MRAFKLDVIHGGARGIRAGQLLKLELLDHVIIGNGNRSSLRELGYFL